VKRAVRKRAALFVFEWRLGRQGGFQQNFKNDIKTERILKKRLYFQKTFRKRGYFEILLKFLRLERGFRFRGATYSPKRPPYPDFVVIYLAVRNNAPEGGRNEVVFTGDPDAL
jgi:hypothetical protein